MIIKCFRCGKEIDSPDDSSADYIIASDTIVREPREVLIALKYNQATRDKQAKIEEVEPNHNGNGGLLKYPGLTIDDSEYDAIEVESLSAAREKFGEDLVKVTAKVMEKDIQKTGIICPDDYNPDTDFVIWGVHKTGAHFRI